MRARRYRMESHRYRDAGQRKSLGESALPAGVADAARADGGMALYPRRWLMLAYLSSLALMSDWICFSVRARARARARARRRRRRLPAPPRAPSRAREGREEGEGSHARRAPPLSL